MLTTDNACLLQGTWIGPSKRGQKNIAQIGQYNMTLMAFISNVQSAVLMQNREVGYQNEFKQQSNLLGLKTHELLNESLH